MRKRIAALFLCLCLTAAGAACEAKGIDPRAVPDDGPPGADYYVTIDPSATHNEGTPDAPFVTTKREKEKSTDEPPQEELYLYLNIPFGSTKEEVIQLAKENAGMDLAEKGNHGASGDVILSPPDDQAVYIGGEEVNVTFYIDEEHGLSKVRLFLLIYSSNETELLKRLPDLLEIVEAFEDSFDMDDQADKPRWMTTEENKVLRYPLVKETQELDMRVIRNELERNLNMALHYCWSNVEGTIKLSAARLYEDSPIVGWGAEFTLEYNNKVNSSRAGDAYKFLPSYPESLFAK